MAPNRLHHEPDLPRWDWVFILAVLALVLIGQLFLDSAGAAPGLLPKHTRWMELGALLFLACAGIDYRVMRRAAPWSYWGSVVLLVLVLVQGVVMGGARRWLVLFGVSFQPAEFAKLALILCLACRLSDPQAALGTWRGLAATLALIALPAGLILMEPALSACAIVVLTGLAMVYVVGGFRTRLGVALVVVTLLLVLTGAGLYATRGTPRSQAIQLTVVEHLPIKDYQRQRIRVFLGLERDPHGSGWTRDQAHISVGTGGAWGKGADQGFTGRLGFLPRSVTATDFIFAIVAEETGYVGSLTILAAYLVVIVFGLTTAMMTTDVLGRLLCVGVVCVVFLHAFIHIAMAVGLFPVTGLPLPLVSYGGSSMVTTMSGLGLVESVYRHSVLVHDAPPDPPTPQTTPPPPVTVVPSPSLAPGP